MAVYPTQAPTKTAKPAAVSAPTPPVAEVTPEVTSAPVPLSVPHPIIGLEPQPIIGIAPRPLFATTAEDAPDLPKVSVPHVRQLTPKTIAEHAAGREMISQYGPAS